MSKNPLAPATKRAPALWQLPPGVAPGTWDYTVNERIAETYDAELANSPIFTFDAAYVQQLVADLHPTPRMIVDLGCGTGRSLLPLAAPGRSLVGVDLSRPMLRVLGRKAAAAGIEATAVQANLVNLDGLADGFADCVLCLFSTLGMVQGRANRRRVLQHTARILRPNGRLILHVHNRWSALADPGGLRWLTSSYWQAWRRPEANFGDRVYGYRGLPNMFLHSFSRREILADLHAAGLAAAKITPLERTGGKSLRSPRAAENLRAGGWLIVAAERS